ncbi:hypothetical protein A2U01_0047849 [Trifolium medium]|uniref:Uncharacterized protein n=1 Tax=Trifolium medium TaxID=97028 RepID=A0A392QS08_9FABA|nr:hypothetical protein [Trifolium medium]
MLRFGPRSNIWRGLENPPLGLYRYRSIVFIGGRHIRVRLMRLVSPEKLPPVFIRFVRI